MADKRDFWEKTLVTGDTMGRGMRRVMRIVPSAPRCALCLAPFRAPGKFFVGPLGFSPSRKNPRFCRT